MRTDRKTWSTIKLDFCKGQRCNSCDVCKNGAMRHWPFGKLCQLRSSTWWWLLKWWWYYPSQLLFSNFAFQWSFHKIHSKQIVCNPIPKFTQCTAVVCFVSSFSLSISIPIFFSMWKPFTTLSSQQYIHQFFTNIRGVRISALYLILNGTKEEHLNMLEGGIIAKLLDEKWSTFAKVVSSTWHWNRDK